MSDPVEVSLVSQVRQCEQCEWQWRSPKLYGPFPQVPADALNTIGTSSEIKDFALPRAAALKGCRKAPIMFVGINPNLTGFWTIPAEGRELKGNHAVYPSFADDREYARHHRYIQKGSHEYQIEGELDTLIDSASAVTAGTAGKIVVTPKNPTAEDTQRFNCQREAQIVLNSENGESKTLPITWGVAENFMALRKDYAAGQQIVGNMTAASTMGKSISVKSNPGSSYFSRAEAYCSEMNFEMGEDVSMHDMVACATPGWSKSQYCIPQDDLIGNCVKKNRYTARQIIQSRPALIVFSGVDAFAMFCENFSSFISPAPKLAEMRTRKPYPPCYGDFLLTMPIEGAGSWVCRMTVFSHFSYPAYSSKLAEGLRVESSVASKFKEKHPQVWNLIGGSTQPENVIQISAELWQALSDQGYKSELGELEKLTGDPRVQCFEEIVTRGLQEGWLKRRENATEQPNTKLCRALGGCAYCTSFGIADACPYGVAPSNEADNKIVRDLLEKI